MNACVNVLNHYHFPTLITNGMVRKEVNERNVKLRPNMLSVRGVVRLVSAKDPHCISHTSLDIPYTLIPYFKCISMHVNVEILKIYDSLE